MSGPAARSLASGSSSNPSSFAEIVADRIQSARAELSARWLARLRELLPVDVRDVFPGDDLLDHIPTLLDEVGAYLRAPEAEELGANTSVIEKARELGVMRHQQRASVHQLLREYDLLCVVLEGFVAEETARLELTPSPQECMSVVGRLSRAVRLLQQTTVDTFVGEYTTTIDRQTKRLDQFNRTVGHELRNTLGTLQLAVTLLGKQATAPEAIDPVRWLGVMQRNIDRMVSILRSMEALTRATGNGDTPTRQRIGVEAVAREVARQLEEMAAARGVTIEIGADLPTVHVDPARLELVLMNLVSNGVKYADPGKERRFVEVALVTDRAGDGTRYAISVRDNGLGIAREKLERVFEPFFRAHAERDGDLGNTGSGLGLAIVEESVRALGGAVEIESQPGEGTRFVITLPDVDEPPAA